MLLGYGVDPLGILVPFIIFAIGVSHGVQKISAVGDAALEGVDGNEAARRMFRLLFVPAIVALLADLVGFVTILAIPVGVIREMAITASLGVGVVIMTDLVLLPILVSFAHFDPGYAGRIRRRQALGAPLWRVLARVATRPVAALLIAAALVLAVAGFLKGRETPIGDTAAGVPELRAASRYNLDTDVITSKFSIGTDIINVIVETAPNGCVNYEVMRLIDEFAWQWRTCRACATSWRCRGWRRSSAPAGARAVSSGATCHATSRAWCRHRAASTPAPACSTRTAA